MADIKIDSHLNEILTAFSRATLVALEQCGMAGETFAKAKCPVDTGNLRNSITHVVDTDGVMIGTNVEYAVYVEMGTGSANVPGGTTKPGYNMKPRPYLKPAATEHTETYKNIFQSVFKNG